MPEKIIPTDDQIAEIVSLYNDKKLGSPKIADRLDFCSKQTVLRILREEGVRIRGRRILTDGEEEQLVQMYQYGLGATRLTRAYSISMGFFRNMLIRRNVSPNRPSQYKINERAFDVIDNEAAAYWLGFIYADGCVYKNRLSIALSARDTKHLEKIKTFLKTDRPLRIDNHKGFGKISKQAHLYVNNDHLSQALVSLGIIANRPNCNLATNKISDDLACHFIRGHMDGNGSIGKNRARIRFIGQKDLMEWTREKLDQLAGTISYPRVKERQNTFILGYYRNHDIANILSFLYNHATIYLQRKRVLADKWI